MIIDNKNQDEKIKISVIPGNWGDAALADIKKLLENITAHFTSHFNDLPAAILEIKQNSGESSPIILYRNSKDDNFVINLDVTDRNWAQYSYQYAHEFCHFLSDFEKLKNSKNKWFHEALCEMASLFALKNMAGTWKNAAPYPNWSSYADSLENYVKNLIDEKADKLPADQSLAVWLKANESALEANQYLRRLNSLVAVELLDFMMENPAQWSSIRYLPNTHAEFRHFVLEWYTACPAKLRGFPEHVAKKFEIALM